MQSPPHRSCIRHVLLLLLCASCASGASCQSLQRLGSCTDLEDRPIVPKPWTGPCTGLSRCKRMIEELAYQQVCRALCVDIPDICQCRGEQSSRHRRVTRRVPAEVRLSSRNSSSSSIKTAVPARKQNARKEGLRPSALRQRIDGEHWIRQGQLSSSSKATPSASVYTCWFVWLCLCFVRLGWFCLSYTTIQQDLICFSSRW